MAKKLAYERYQWFHGQVVSGRYPNAKTLSEQFEISYKQAQRDIEFIRDRLYAPLKYDTVNRGYVYEGGYELPPVWFSKDEFIAFCLATRLASTIPDGELKRGLKGFLEKFLSLRTIGNDKWYINDIEGLVSVKNVEYYKVKEEVFRTVLNALFKRLPLKITYHTPHKREQTKRTILPLHLLCYMGSWHLIAFCNLRNGLRDFTLSRIQDICQAEERISLPSGLPPVKDYIRKNFGVIAGEDSKWVVLKFSPMVSPWVSEQVWHDIQETTRDEDGGIILKFPVAGFEEVLREILRYGADVEVISPPELKAMIISEIKKMEKIYR
ncbi:MAG: WYL domain-containing protein [Syntrophorhabdaceae bacterium]|nr:WYL domain-containing protein [Syntrophorhabdaceae bacterium]